MVVPVCPPGLRPPRLASWGRCRSAAHRTICSPRRSTRPGRDHGCGRGWERSVLDQRVDRVPVRRATARGRPSAARLVQDGMIALDVPVRRSREDRVFASDPRAGRRGRSGRLCSSTATVALSRGTPVDHSGGIEGIRLRVQWITVQATGSWFGAPTSAHRRADPFGRRRSPQFSTRDIFIAAPMASQLAQGRASVLPRRAQQLPSTAEAAAPKDAVTHLRNALPPLRIGEPAGRGPAGRQRSGRCSHTGLASRCSPYVTASTREYKPGCIRLCLGAGRAPEVGQSARRSAR